MLLAEVCLVAPKRYRTFYSRIARGQSLTASLFDPCIYKWIRSQYVAKQADWMMGQNGSHFDGSKRVCWDLG
ncbi:hypothetical protein Hanom_Chr03g00236811 [Helianthus anomalus]